MTRRPERAQSRGERIALAAMNVFSIVVGPAFSLVAGAPLLAVALTFLASGSVGMACRLVSPRWMWLAWAVCLLAIAALVTRIGLTLPPTALIGFFWGQAFAGWLWPRPGAARARRQVETPAA